MQHHHGGDLESYYRQYGREPLDFSANISPLGLPEGVRRAIVSSLEHAAEYPDPLCRKLREALAAHEHLPARQILCGNGAADLIFRLALALHPKRALVTAPSFAEYEAAMCAAGCRVDAHPLAPGSGFRLTESILERIVPGTDLVFLCQPNNPTGQLTEKALLLKILERCRARGAVLVMDECFTPFLDNPAAYSLQDQLPEYGNLLILKAFTKLYAMPGLRLGYALCSNLALLEKLRGAAQPWPVSGPAQAAGIAALRESRYVRDLRALLRTEKPAFVSGLRSAGLEVFGSGANFVFFRSGDPLLHEKLLDRGIMLRSCDNYRGLAPGYYRAAVRTHPENQQLLGAIRELAGAQP